MEDVDFKRDKLGFLYRTISMKPFCMSCWLENDEFVEAVWKEVLKGTKITDEVVLEILHPLYAKISQNRELYPNFKIQNARRGLHQLERSMA